jgi:hypothetical protein
MNGVRQEFGKAQYPREIEKNIKRVSVTRVGHLVKVRDMFFNGSSSPLRAQSSYPVRNNFSQTAEQLGREISSLQGRYPHTG